MLECVFTMNEQTFPPHRRHNHHMFSYQNQYVFYERILGKSPFGVRIEIDPNRIPRLSFILYCQRIHRHYSPRWRSTSNYFYCFSLLHRCKTGTIRNYKAINNGVQNDFYSFIQLNKMPYLTLSLRLTLCIALSLPPAISFLANWSHL